MTDEEYARYSSWQQVQNQPHSRLNEYSQRPYGEVTPPGAGYVWQPYAMGGGQWVTPAPVRLSDEDVQRIAEAVVLRLRAGDRA